MSMTSWLTSNRRWADSYPLPAKAQDCPGKICEVSMKAHKSRDVSIFSISGTQNSPGSSLLPCEAWEKVAEGRMRALSRSERGFQQHLLTGKEPSPTLRAPSPILRTGERECLEEARRLIHFPRTALRFSGEREGPIAKQWEGEGRREGNNPVPRKTLSVRSR